MATDGIQRRLVSAELLSIGTELTAGETRDTNAGELARALTDLGVEVRRLTGIPDRLDIVTEAFRAGLDRADIVVSTGGLGPTPDDLTREAIAAACGETPVVDPDLEAWLRALWARRRMPFPEMNLKQAWLIPSATALPNPNGTAPGWFVHRPAGPVIVALPGPPREMRPMWQDQVLPRLAELGLGADTASRTFRLAGIGESQVADILGETLLRTPNPEVATYARAEAVDVRVSAVGDGSGSAEAMVERTAAVVLERLGPYVWAEGATTWSDAIGSRLGELEWTLAISESGVAGRLAALIGDVPWLRRAEAVSKDVGTAADADERDALEAEAERVRREGAASVGLALRASSRGGDTEVDVAITTPRGARHAHHIVFLDGANGRLRAALSAASTLLDALREP